MEHLIEDPLHFSRVVRSRGLLFVSGLTGTAADGTVSPDPEEQFELLFARLHHFLAAAGATVGDLVEITTYHVDFEGTFDTFLAVKDRHLTRPFPAWTAVGTTRLITPGTLAELRAIAEDPRVS